MKLKVTPYRTIQNPKTLAKRAIFFCIKCRASGSTTEKNKPLQLTLTKGAPLA